MPDREIPRARPSGNLTSAVPPSLRLEVLPSLRAKPDASGKTDTWALPNESVLPGTRVWFRVAILGDMGVAVGGFWNMRGLKASSADTRGFDLIGVSGLFF